MSKTPSGVYGGGGVSNKELKLSKTESGMSDSRSLSTNESKEWKKITIASKKLTIFLKKEMNSVTMLFIKC